jgi:Tfp pilus assembly protein FimT
MAIEPNEGGVDVAKQNSQRAFSLVQLLITLQFGAVIALIAAPSLTTFRAHYQLMSASNQLGFDIIRARMQAVGQAKYVQIRILNTTQYQRQTSTDGSTWVNERTTKLPAGVTAAPASATVRFDKRGFATIYNSITLTNSLGKLKTVATSIIGRVTIT